MFAVARRSPTFSTPSRYFTAITVVPCVSSPAGTAPVETGASVTRPFSPRRGPTTSRKSPGLVIPPQSYSPLRCPGYPAIEIAGYGNPKSAHPYGGNSFADSPRVGLALNPSPIPRTSAPPAVPISRARWLAHPSAPWGARAACPPFLLATPLAIPLRLVRVHPAHPLQEGAGVRPLHIRGLGPTVVPRLGKRLLGSGPLNSLFTLERQHA